MDRLNAVLRGRYTVRRELGAGGMATVYLADDLRHGRPVAVKVLKPEIAHAVGAERFLREIKITAQLNHPHILPLLDSGAADGLLYYVMPYFEGESLRSRLERERQLALDEALRITAEVADALTFAHGHGVVHRDIKPGNILLSSGHAVVADFGIARAVSAAGGVALTETATSVGTPEYMSPEQIAGDVELDGRSDLYSLACVLYEMLAGEPPHTSRSAQAIFAKRLSLPAPSVRTVRDTVPVEVEAALTRALAKAPADRFATPERFVEALRSGARSEPSRVPASRDRWKTRVAGAAALLAALAWLSLSQGATGTLGYQEGEWILVTQFQNATGNPILDESLDVAFSLTLQQSPLVKVFPTSRIQAALARMMVDRDSPITETIGAEIALREGVRFVLVPSVAAVGGRYALGLSFRDPQGDEPLHTELIQVEGIDEILPGLDELGARAREILGESLRTVPEPVPLARATTSSLPALRQFSLAVAARSRFTDLEEARRLFNSALEIDSVFAAAHVELGLLELEFFGNREEGVRHLAAGFAHRDRLTEYERLMITALYHDNVDRDHATAADAYESLADLYPNRVEPLNNLAWLYWRMGRLEDAVAKYRETLRVDPEYNWAYSSMNILQLFHLGWLDSGRVAARRQTEEDALYDWAWNHLGWGLLARDSVEAAAEAFAKAAELNPREGMHWEGLAHAYRLRGRAEDAAAALGEVLQIDSLSFDAHYELGQLHQRAGAPERARPHLLDARRLLDRQLAAAPGDGLARARLALILAKLGEPAEAAAEARRALDAASPSPDALFALACYAMASGRREEAIGLLQRAVAAGYTDVLWLMRHPELEPLWQDPDFTTLVQSMID